jgi:hypothetical protein
MPPSQPLSSRQVNVSQRASLQYHNFDTKPHTELELATGSARRRSHSASAKAYERAAAPPEQTKLPNKHPAKDDSLQRHDVLRRRAPSQRRGTPAWCAPRPYPDFYYTPRLPFSQNTRPRRRRGARLGHRLRLPSAFQPPRFES